MLNYLKNKITKNHYWQRKIKVYPLRGKELYRYDCFYNTLSATRKFLRRRSLSQSKGDLVL